MNNPISNIIRRLNEVLNKSKLESCFDVSRKTIGPKPISINFETSTVKATIEENKPYCSTPRFLAISVTETRVMSISTPLPKKIDVTLPETFVVGCIGYSKEIYLQKLDDEIIIYLGVESQMYAFFLARNLKSPSSNARFVKT